MTNYKNFLPIKEVLYTRTYPNYIYRKEILDDSRHGGDGDLEVKSYYSKSGCLIDIGSPKQAKFLTEVMELTQLQGIKDGSSQVSLGFNEDSQQWYGWTHRAMCGFTIGDRIYEEGYGNDETPLTHHGSQVIENLDQAKQSAINFVLSH